LAHLDTASPSRPQPDDDTVDAPVDL
jgi:hypothetical protein